MDYKLLDEIKKITIIALVSDDDLLEKLVLKGGNAINLIHKISERASVDIDMSMKTDFSVEELKKVKVRIQNLLKITFNDYNYEIIDYKFKEKPGKIHPGVRHFWGGYDIEFKILRKEDFNSTNSEVQRRNKAIVIKENNSTKFSIDISKFEFTDGKIEDEIDGYMLYAYSPEMIVCEKIRAICQQLEDYKEVTKSFTATSRARDFFDIYILIDHFKIDLKEKDNIELLKSILHAKKVPFSYLERIQEMKSLHESSFPVVRDTITNKEKLESFDFYFVYLIKIIKEIYPRL